MSISDFFADAPQPEPEDVLRSDLMQMITDRDRATPRHQQIELGPSEIGHRCLRRLAYGLTATERANPYYDPLPSIIGTATHTWLFEAAVEANLKLNRIRWYAETKLEISQGLRGTCDLYDGDSETVIDWKVPGANRFTTYRKNMSAIYRTQVHLYGKGFVNAGYKVKQVAICLLPRGGSLSSMHLWSEPYNETIADEAIGRREMVIALCSDWDVERNPDRYQWFATTPSDCVFCPQWRPNPVGPLQCKGDQ